MKKRTISIEEESCIKESIYKSSTQQIGRATIITELITGYLEGICISVDKPSQVQISIEGMDNVIIFDSNNKQLQGTNYFLLRSKLISNNFEEFTQQSDKWVLNDKLRIEVLGMADTGIEIKVRYS
jgi:hypothetical protein